jgi:hypothetical protein
VATRRSQVAQGSVSVTTGEAHRLSAPRTMTPRGTGPIGRDTAAPALRTLSNCRFYSCHFRLQWSTAHRSADLREHPNATTFGRGTSVSTTSSASPKRTDGSTSTAQHDGSRCHVRGRSTRRVADAGGLRRAAGRPPATAGTKSALASCTTGPTTKSWQSAGPSRRQRIGGTTSLSLNPDTLGQRPAPQKGRPGHGGPGWPAPRSMDALVYHGFSARQVRLTAGPSRPRCGARRVASPSSSSSTASAGTRAGIAASLTRSAVERADRARLTRAPAPKPRRLRASRPLTHSCACSTGAATAHPYPPEPGRGTHGSSRRARRPYGSKK